MALIMYDYVIKDIEALLRKSFKKDKSIELYSLVSTIGYRHKLVPEVQEINVALANIANYRIERLDEKLIIQPAETTSSEKITQLDLDKVHQKSMDDLVDLISRLKGGEEPYNKRVKLTHFVRPTT